MSDSSQAQSEQGTEFRLRDELPPVCVVCGEPATGRRSLPVEAAQEASDKAMTMIQMVSLCFGFLFFWWRTSPGGPDNMWVALPHCDLHGGEELARISVYAISKYRGEICGASPSFCEALQTLSKPPSDDILGAIDAGPAEDAETFLDEIDRSTVKTSQEFLRDLEGDKDR